MKFARDYKGRTFSGLMTLNHISENLFSAESYQIEFGSGHSVDCTHDGQSATMMDWTPGQTKVQVRGIIDDTIMGDIQLLSCTYNGSTS
jgi:hypothetical protein